LQACSILRRIWAVPPTKDKTQIPYPIPYPTPHREVSVLPHSRDENFPHICGFLAWYLHTLPFSLPQLFPTPWHGTCVPPHNTQSLPNPHPHHQPPTSLSLPVHPRKEIFGMVLAYRLFNPRNTPIPLAHFLRTPPMAQIPPTPPHNTDPPGKSPSLPHSRKEIFLHFSHIFLIFPPFLAWCLRTQEKHTNYQNVTHSIGYYLHQHPHSVMLVVIVSKWLVLPFVV